MTAARPVGDRTVEATVEYEWAGQRLSGTVIERRVLDVGGALDVRVDPLSPTRVWSTTQYTPPGTTEGDLAGLGLITGAALLVAGGYLHVQSGRRSAGGLSPVMAWRALEVVDGRLWYGRNGPVLPGCQARFDVDALVLVDRDGVEARYRWDEHQAAGGGSGQGTWQLQAFVHTHYRPPTVSLTVARKWGSTMAEHRLGGLSWMPMPSEELPAMAAYLAATPAARASLADPERLTALVTDLATGAWRRPRPPGRPLLGDRLDLHLAVVRVLGSHLRRFGDRAVRGEPTPELEQLVVETIATLPVRMRPRITTEAVAEELTRHLAVGRWPFDVLLPSIVPTPAGPLD